MRESGKPCRIEKQKSLKCQLMNKSMKVNIPQKYSSSLFLGLHIISFTKKTRHKYINNRICLEGDIISLGTFQLVKLLTLNDRTAECCLQNVFDAPKMFCYDVFQKSYLIL